MLKRILSLALSLALMFGVAHADLDVHFLDVGQGDAALVICGGEAMLIARFFRTCPVLLLVENIIRHISVVFQEKRLKSEEKCVKISALWVDLWIYRFTGASGLISGGYRL